MRKLLISCLSFFICSTIYSQTIYVSTNGNDTNDGSENAPYKSFSKAVSVMTSGDICIIKGGTYEEPLIINKSGISGSYLTFKAANGETVNIKATRKLTGWQQHSGTIYKTNVNMSIDSRFRAVYHHGEYMDLARWPNNTDNNRWTIDCHPVSGGGSGNYITATGIPDIDWENGGLLYYLGAHSGTSWTRPITGSSATRIDHQQVDITKWPFGIHNPEVWRSNPGNERGQFYLFNKLEALDYAREWYYDSAANMIYFQPADGNLPVDGTVEYAVSKYVAEITGDYVKLEGLDFFGGSIKIHNNADNNQIINCKIIHGSEGHDSLSNTSAQVGEAALEVLGANTLIQGNIIDHSSVSGIHIMAWAGAHNCVVEKNTISNTDYNGIHASPIRTSADNLKILKNTIFNTGRDGMYVAGTNCEVAYNDVSASQKINSDSGIFYTVGNANPKNNEIHHNWFHDATAPAYSHSPDSPAKAAGIYLDNNSKGYTVHHNVVWNVSWSAYQVNWNNVGLNFYHNTIWNAERAMDSWVNGYTQSDNKIYNNFSNKGDWFTGNDLSEFDIQDNLITAVSVLENPENLDFMPKENSALIDQGRVISGFEKPFKGVGPDIGAYERLGTRWTAGINAIEDTGSGDIVSVLDTQFTILTTSETCSDENNGTLTIEASTEADYNISLDGNDFAFTKNKTITNLTPGSYELCISIKGINESQCFVVNIDEALQITSKSTLSNKKLNIELSEGTTPYKVYINNDMVLETQSPSFSVDVSQGDIVKIQSNKPCEGEIIKSIDFYSNIQPFPNPTTGVFQISIPINEGLIPIEIYNMTTQLVKAKTYTIIDGKITIDLTNNPPGVYFANLVLDKPINIKIIKK
ncbi:right-handed parallel beta-helix repeat-containing protein [Tamlana fucoidanivorans]|uniref:T9SS type A sorting domain-containing protein n=1 Tax=Allotamlana fucoidanivorans TaxID=2583814 RepID=A0A5C4SFM1_9FLAO|nr:T9SS type A sorting domain-containing protein [Tamlana fucoidanivorans]TNJ41534.1 T9SS type A sorting domain-containing protein [Tamlana fucoidanivorans]